MACNVRDEDMEINMRIPNQRLTLDTSKSKSGNKLAGHTLKCVPLSTIRSDIHELALESEPNLTNEEIRE